MPSIQRPTIREVIRQYSADGVLDNAEITKIQSDFADVQISEAEFNELKDVLESSAFESVSSEADLKLFLSEKLVSPDGSSLLETVLDTFNAGAITEVTEKTDLTTMDDSGYYRPVFMTEAGFFVTEQDASEPESAKEMASGLFAMAQMVDDVAYNPFQKVKISKIEKEKVLSSLQESLKFVATSEADLPADMDKTQVLQMRSSIATVLLSFMKSASEYSDKDMYEEAFMVYRNMLKVETNPVLKDSMIWNLVAVKDQLPRASGAKIKMLKEQIAPTAPPYDDWFKDGNKTLNISYTTGEGVEFLDGAAYMLKKQGYGLNQDLSIVGTKVFSKEVNGMPVNVYVRENRNSVFDKMADENIQFTMYSGHSDFGRNTVRSLQNAPDSDQKKLIFLGLCSGKDNIHTVRNKYPESQLMTTFTSSYFGTSVIDGEKIATSSEDFSAMMVLINGISKRDNWEDMSAALISKVTGNRSAHVMNEKAYYYGHENYVTPISTLIRRRVLDSDYDGQADIFDKFIEFDTLKIVEDTAREFTPLAPSRSVEILDGTRVHVAAQGLNTAMGYNQITSQHMKDHRVINDGYFTAENDNSNRIVKFEETKLPNSDHTFYKMTVNKDYAHMSSDALRTVAGYQFMMDKIDYVQPKYGRQPLSDIEKKLSALVMAAALLNYDNGGYYRDADIWSNMLTTFNLPAELEYSFVRDLITFEHHDYTGNMKMVKTWIEELEASHPAVLEALEQADVGFPVES